MKKRKDEEKKNSEREGREKRGGKWRKREDKTKKKGGFDTFNLQLLILKRIIIMRPIGIMYLIQNVLTRQITHNYHHSNMT